MHSERLTSALARTPTIECCWPERCELLSALARTEDGNPRSGEGIMKGFAPMRGVVTLWLFLRCPSAVRIAENRGR